MREVNIVRRGAAVVMTMGMLVACTGSAAPSDTDDGLVTLAPISNRTTTVPSSAASAPTGTDGAATTLPPLAWTVDTSTCGDPARAEQPIEGHVKIGSVMPLTGGPAVVFGPIKDGFQLYLDHAADSGLLPGYTVTVDIGDDQYDSTKTSAAVNGLVDDGVDLVTAIIGTPNNLAARDILNETCIPQLLALTGSAAWAQVNDYPWTTGAVVPYDVEAAIYSRKLKELKPNASVAIFSVDNDFGKAYADAFKKQADSDGLHVVDEQTVAADVSDPPSTQLADIAGRAPDAIVAFPLGLQCPAFLTELANAKTQHPGWDPAVFLTNTCASRLFLGLAGPAADGVYTSNTLLDANDAKNENQPGMKAFLETYAAASLTGDPGATATGWNAAELTMAILDAAARRGPLTRKSIIDAARNLTYTPSLARPGIAYKMSGATDPYAFQSLQVLQWDASTQTFDEIGDAVMDFES
jgi:branched-chain amino acid transport system substrate-binding protein